MTPAPTLADRIVLVMAFKHTQRRTAQDIAQQLHLPDDLIGEALQWLEIAGLTLSHQDGSWTLSSAGNMRRNDLTAHPKEGPA